MALGRFHATGFRNTATQNLVFQPTPAREATFRFWGRGEAGALVGCAEQGERESSTRRSLRFLACCAPWLRSVLLVTLLFTGLSSASSWGQQLTSGTSSRGAREEALQAIPLQDLTQAAQQKLLGVLENPSLYRRLPTTAIEVDPEYLVFLCRYPEVIVEIWRLMNVTQMSTERVGPYVMRCDDGAGTKSEVELVYGNENVHVYYGEGLYQGPVWKREIAGQCVILLRTKPQRDAGSGRTQMVCHLDIFMKMDSAAVGLLAKTLNPLVGKAADQNFVESLKFVQRLNETTEKNGPGVQGMAYRLSGLTPQVRQDFIEVAGRVYDRFQLQVAQQLNMAPATTVPSGELAVPVRYPPAGR